MNSSEALMLSGVTGVCPDCGDERILLQIAEAEYCCASCDAAVFLFGVQPAAVATRYTSAA